MLIRNYFKLKETLGAMSVVLLVSISPAQGAGFAIAENSASGLGAGFSGGGAIAEDGSAAWFNPAGMRRLDNQVSSALHAIFPDTKVKNASGSSVFAGGPTGGSGNVDDIGKNGYVPNLYTVYNLNEDITLGLSVNAPWGLVTKYDDPGWAGRIQARTSSIKTINFNPSIAGSITDNLHIGAGISILYFDARFTNSTASGAGADLEGDDVAVGFNTGLLYEFNDDARVSIHYRSKIELEVEGDAKFNNGGASFPDQEISSDITLPDMLSVSGYWRFVDSFAVTADYTFTRWSEIQDLRFQFKGSGVFNGIKISDEINEDLEWEDVSRVSLGFHYYHNSRLTLRTGFVYDESPVKSAEFRTPRLPDTDRYWVTFGGSYQINDSLGIDLGYAHVFMKDTRINRTTGKGLGVNTVTADYENGIDIFSAQANYKF